MHVTSRYFFADPTAEVCQQLIGRLFEVDEVRALEILPARAWAQIEYRNGLVSSRSVAQKIARHLQNGHDGGRPPYVNSPRDLPRRRRGGGLAGRAPRRGALHLGDRARAARPHPSPQSADPAQAEAVRGYRARPHARPRRRPVRRELQHGHRPDPLRSAAGSPVTSSCRSSIRRWSTPNARRTRTPSFSPFRGLREIGPARNRTTAPRSGRGRAGTSRSRGFPWARPPWAMSSIPR